MIFSLLVHITLSLLPTLLLKNVSVEHPTADFHCHCRVLTERKLRPADQTIDTKMAFPSRYHKPNAYMTWHMISCKLYCTLNKVRSTFLFIYNKVYLN